jgi:hypothetical protein
VSTNSICQGEQAGVVWRLLFSIYGVKIHFAHQTFKWSNEAKGVAAVHCVIVGFSNFDVTKKRLYTYVDAKAESTEVPVTNINGYLAPAKDLFIENRKRPLCTVPDMNYGSMPIDDGHLVVEKEVMSWLKVNEPAALTFIRPYTGGDEFINNKPRWCIWIKEEQLSQIRSSRFIMDRITSTKNFRLSSKREATNKLASFPAFFGERRQPNSEYVIVPKVSSENRVYIPIGFLNPDTISSGSALIIPDAKIYHFGILTSKMHMSWMKYVCGRLESRYQYSASIVYNNYPWPIAPTDKQKQVVEEAAQAVLEARAQFPESSLADLYDPNTMPPVLVKAHQQLDKAVDQCYRSQLFTTEAKRIEYLFELYEKYTGGMFIEEKPKKLKKQTS